MECGRTPGHCCNVLAVIGDAEQRSRQVLSVAVDLAELHHARLTLAKTSAAGRLCAWIAPLAAFAAYVPPALDSREDAARVLARVLKEVPAGVPVTTMLLDESTHASLMRLLRSGNYGALVAERSVVAHDRRLRRVLAAESLAAILVGADGALQASQDPWPHGFSAVTVRRQFSSNTEGGTADAAQILKARGRHRLHLRHWHGGRLLGAGRG